MPTRGPTAVGVSDRKIDRRRFLFFPDGARNLFAVKQVMLDAGEHAAPVAAVERFVNHSTDFYINSVATEDFVVDTTKQIQKPALFSLRWVVAVWLTIAPCFGFVMRHET